MKGTYVLIVLVEKSREIRIGKLGEFLFEKGYYAYVGSAFGKATNIENRIKRYKKLAEEKKGNLKWHIDYLLASDGVKIVDVIKFNDKIECIIVQEMRPKSKIPIKKFGSSDCKCPTHLFYLGEEWKWLKSELHNKFNVWKP